jgi:hypothetical protein
MKSYVKEKSLITYNKFKIMYQLNLMIKHTIFEMITPQFSDNNVDLI